jgi:hypothetical protein
MLTCLTCSPCLLPGHRFSVPHPLAVPQAHVTLYLHQNFADCVEAAEGKRQLGAAAAGALRQLVQLHGVAVLLEAAGDLQEGGYITGKGG